MTDSGDRTRPTQADHAIAEILGGRAPAPPKPRARRTPLLRILDDGWRENMPEFVPEGWRPRGGIPESRADCKDGPRPCPFVRCRYHLWPVVGADRAGRPHGGRRAPTILRPATPASCALDLIDRNPDGLSHKEIGALFGITGERIRQIRRDAIAKLVKRGIKLGG
jgi:hypothetical protein